MLLALALAWGVASPDGGPDDFWDALADDSVVVEAPGAGRLYHKARFRCPVQRRLRLYPGAHRAVMRLQHSERVEFVYDAKVPSLVFLDSQDVAVEKIDIAKLSEEEILGAMNLRGFADFPEESGADADADAGGEADAAPAA
jgi:hypothetical protein